MRFISIQFNSRRCASSTLSSFHLTSSVALWNSGHGRTIKVESTSSATTGPSSLHSTSSRPNGTFPTLRATSTLLSTHVALNPLLTSQSKLFCEENLSSTGSTSFSRVFCSPSPFCSGFSSLRKAAKEFPWQSPFFSPSHSSCRRWRKHFRWTRTAYRSWRCFTWWCWSRVPCRWAPPVLFWWCITEVWKRRHSIYPTGWENCSLRSSERVFWVSTTNMERTRLMVL